MAHNHTMPHVLDLPEDLLRDTLLPLDSSDVCTAASVCKRLHRIATEDNGPLWEAQCQRWFNQQAVKWQEPPVNAQAVKETLKLQGYRSMYKGIQNLGGHSPVGVWWLTAPMDNPIRMITKGLLFIGAAEEEFKGISGAHPCLSAYSPCWTAGPEGAPRFVMDRLFIIHLARPTSIPASPDSTPAGSDTPSGPSSAVQHTSSRPSPQQATGGSGGTVSCSASDDPFPYISSAPDLCAKSMFIIKSLSENAAEVPFSTTEEVDLVEYKLAGILAANAYNGDSAAEQEEKESDKSSSTEQKAIQVHKKGFRAQVLLEEHGHVMVLQTKVPMICLEKDQLVTKTLELRFRRVLGLHSKLPSPQMPVPAALESVPSLWRGLHDMQGLWTAEYGSHGPEILQLRACSGPSPDVTGQPSGMFGGARLEVFKLVGDPNVPSGKISFMADLQRCRLGRYDGVALLGDEPDDRPILTFLGTGMGIVNLSQRPVLARFAGRGQINRIPGQWNPEWEHTEVVFYQDKQGQLDKRVFSVLWRDRGSILQIMDCLPLPLAANHSWLLPASDTATEDEGIATWPDDMERGMLLP